MGLYEYEQSKDIERRGYSFDALIMAVMRQADSLNQARLELHWGDLWDELKERYNAPGGRLEGDPE